MAHSSANMIATSLRKTGSQHSGKPFKWQETRDGVTVPDKGFQDLRRPHDRIGPRRWVRDTLVRRYAGRHGHRRSHAHRQSLPRLMIDHGTIPTLNVIWRMLFDVPKL